MPLPKIQYSVDKFNDGRFIVTRVEDGTPVEEMGRYHSAEEAKKEAINLQSLHITEELFPYIKSEGLAWTAESEKLDELVSRTRTYFRDLLEILPMNNGDSQQARLLVRQAFNFAKTAILMDGLV